MNLDQAVRSAATIALLVAAGCGNPEVRIGSAQGIPSVTGSTEVGGLDTFTCGNPIPAGEYTIATRAVGNDCELTFDRDVQVLEAGDYESVPDLKGTTSIVQAVELEVKKLAFSDASTGQVLDPQTRITSAMLKVNGQMVANRETLARLPVTVRLDGEALSSFKTKIDARQPASVRATSVVLLPQAPRPPAKMKIEYDAQPTLVLGTGGLHF